MPIHVPFVDIHCHLLPGIDDGAKSWDDTLAMARMAEADGIRTVVATPHQLGGFAHNRGETIRELADQAQQFLDQLGVALQVLPGADIRIEPEMVAALRAGDVVSLADRRRHALLELPHELYYPLEPVLDDLHRHGMVGVLSHPERNQGIIRQPKVLSPLVRHGCLMQITAGSLLGAFGSESQLLAEWMLAEGLVHFVASDGHGPKSRRPLLSRAFERVVQLTDEETAADLFCHHPAAVAAGRDVAGDVRPRVKSAKGVPAKRWWKWGRAA